MQLTLGSDIYTISKILGHRNVKTTQIYAKIIDEKKREAANKIKLKSGDYMFFHRKNSSGVPKPSAEDGQKKIEQAKSGERIKNILIKYKTDITQEAVKVIKSICYERCALLNYCLQ